MTVAVDQILADLDRLHRQHEAELSDLVERHASERDALVASLRTLTSAPASPAPDLEPSPTARCDQAVEEPDFVHVNVAADRMGVSPSTIRRWADEYGARWQTPSR